MAQFAQALFALKIVGGIYLIYLAIKAGRSALASDVRIEQLMAAAPTVSGFSLYQRGLLMHLTNPKALLGWIATMTLGLGPEATPTTVAIILAGCAVMSIMIFCGYAIVFSTAPMIRGYRKARRWIEGTLVLMFGAAGIKLLLSRRDKSGYFAHMKSTNARTFGAARRLDVCKTQSSGSTPDTVPHWTNSPQASWFHAMDCGMRATPPPAIAASRTIINEEKLLRAPFESLR